MSLIALCFAAALVLVSGCQEQSSAAGVSVSAADTPELSIDAADTKKARLIAAENIELKKQLEQCAKEIERQKGLLEECKQQALKDKEAGDKFTEFLFTENVRLEEENKQLKEKLEQK